MCITGGIDVIVKMFYSFDRVARLRSSWNVPRMIETAGEDTTVGFFTKVFKINVAKGLYNALQSGRKLNMQINATHIGNSTLSTKMLLRGDLPASVLASAELCNIRVNLATRRPEPIPNTIKETLSSLPKPPLFSLNFDVPVNVPIYIVDYTRLINPYLTQTDMLMSLFTNC